MALVSPEGRFLRVNRALCEMAGYDEAQLLALDVRAIAHPEDLVADADRQRALLEGAVDVYEAEKRYLHGDGGERWARVGVSAVREDDGRVQYLIAQAHDVTARRRFEDELAHRALHDPLTGLPNRALFISRLGHALVRRRRHAGGVAALFVDLDRFKLVNDGMGHRAGDAVLLEVARRLSQAVRVDDTVARFGGDEFTILCEDADEDAARAVAQRVLDAFARPFVHEGRELHLTTSIGIGVTDLASVTADALLRDADLALYAAKERGRGRYEVFDGESRMAGVDPLAVEQALRLALRDGQLRLHYQPEAQPGGRGPGPPDAPAGHGAGGHGVRRRAHARTDGRAHDPQPAHPRLGRGGHLRAGRRGAHRVRQRRRGAPHRPSPGRDGGPQRPRPRPPQPRRRDPLPARGVPGDRHPGVRRDAQRPRRRVLALRRHELPGGVHEHADPRRGPCRGGGRRVPRRHRAAGDRAHEGGVHLRGQP
jgi:diguanylate cyclase (GGDEF)-like protein/PAS domain S-box-containing protein